ncbi:hypothetical protein [Luteimicrobium subarcticum]|uniref:Uncharacterized protein n=1 Tax=Luteimicrobium subarcticum TaxID=620910 RepID=A0A2M8WRI4_9MICO|nr:hypothetical protein [Luteimicrobium subarcticum]PJI93550.1 hypothetical protein CLV34_2125 [Luteimicrobium subarcticum]
MPALLDVLTRPVTARPSLDTDATSGPGAELTTDVAAEAEAWLRTQPRPRLEVSWVRRGRVTLVRDAAHLASLVAALGQGAFGVLETPSVRWAQTMRVDGGYVVEVNGVPGPDCFVRRAVALPGPGRDAGSGDLVPTVSEAADLLWCWVHARALPGYELTPLGDHRT